MNVEIFELIFLWGNVFLRFGAVFSIFESIGLRDIFEFLLKGNNIIKCIQKLEVFL